MEIGLLMVGVLGSLTGQASRTRSLSLAGKDSGAHCSDAKIVPSEKTNGNEGDPVTATQHVSDRCTCEGKKTYRLHRSSATMDK